jgi:nucleoside-diphosphate-sugar epimerase
VTNEQIFVISGSSGFIGKNVLKKLALESKCKTICINKKLQFKIFNFNQTISIRYLNDLHNLIYKKEVIFIHCATKFESTNTTDSWENLYNANVKFPIHIIEYLAKICNLNLINLNSYWQATNGKIGSSISLYARSKIKFIYELQRLKVYPQIKHIDFYLFDTYGPNDNRDKLIPYLFNSFLYETPIFLNNVGQFLNYLHIEDIVAGILECPITYSNNVFELSSSDNFSIVEIFNLFKKVTGKDLECNWGNQEPLIFMKNKWKIAQKPDYWKESIKLELGLKKIWDKILLEKSTS